MSKLTKCDDCHLAKTPIIYLRTSRKLCMLCWQAERETLKGLVEMLPEIEDVDPPLGYHFVVNDWYTDELRGKLYTDFVYDSLAVCLS